MSACCRQKSEIIDDATQNHRKYNGMYFAMSNEPL